MNKTKKQPMYSAEMRECAVQMVREHRGEHASQWAAVKSIAAKTLQNWMNKADVDTGLKAGVPTEMAERMKALERENQELRQAMKS